MRRGVLGLALVLILAAAAVVLRGQLSQPEPPASASVAHVVTSALPWQRVALPTDVVAAPPPVADQHRRAFAVRGAVRRLVTEPATSPIELPTGTVRASLLGRHLLVQRETAPGVTELSTVDLESGRRTTAPDRLSAEPAAAAVAFVVALADERCLAVFEPATLTRLATHCADPGWSISLLTAEADGAQWRETAPGRPCARWFRLDHTGARQPLGVGDAACRAAVLVRIDGWELTADFPPYEAGAAHPGPLVARHGQRELRLDTAVLAPLVCGGHVYWLSRPGHPDQRGELTRWAPGSTQVETLPIDGQLDAAPPRCVNGVLNVPTPPMLWLLASP